MSESNQPKVTVTKNGPYRVEGALPLSKQIIGADPDGASRTWTAGQAYETQAAYSLCRCGDSANKPFCDGTHARIGFDGTETANPAPYLEQAGAIDGPTMFLTDAESLCAFARFCDPDGSVWALVGEAETEDARAKVREMAGNCPSGRLVAWDKATKRPIEPELPLSVGLIEDPQQEVSGPIWLRGGITLVSADGAAYEVRNRVTVCRCGASANKPFCDGSHATVGFTDDK